MQWQTMSLAAPSICRAMSIHPKHSDAGIASTNASVWFGCCREVIFHLLMWTTGQQNRTRPTDGCNLHHRRVKCSYLEG